MENGAKKQIKQESMRASLPCRLWRQIWRNNRQAKIETQLIHQIGSLYHNARGYKTLAEREVGIATILGIFNTVNESDHIRD